MSNEKLCPNCNIIIQRRNIKGQIMPWKDFPRVMITEDIVTLGCSSCHENYMTEDEISKIDDILESVIKKETSDILNDLKKISGLTQKKLAKEIGLSEVYFSNLISLKLVPSYEKFNYLKLLTKNYDLVSNDSVVGSAFLNNVVEMEKFRHLYKEEAKLLSKGSQFNGIFDDENERVAL